MTVLADPPVQLRQLIGQIRRCHDAALRLPVNSNGRARKRERATALTHKLMLEAQKLGVTPEQVADLCRQVEASRTAVTPAGPPPDSRSCAPAVPG